MCVCWNSKTDNLCITCNSARNQWLHFRVRFPSQGFKHGGRVRHERVAVESRDETMRVTMLLQVSVNKQKMAISHKASGRSERYRAAAYDLRERLLTAPASHRLLFFPISISGTKHNARQHRPMRSSPPSVFGLTMNTIGTTGGGFMGNAAERRDRV